MQIDQINSAITNFCYDLQDRIKPKCFDMMTEKELIVELINCILGSNVKYEMSITYAYLIGEYLECLDTSEIINADFDKKISLMLSSKAINQVIGKEFNSYRFPNRASTNIHKTISNIKSRYGTVSKLIQSFSDYRKLRLELVNICYGIGPKQASHFLKNIGFTDNIAIIDSHILNYLKLNNNCIPLTYNVSTIKNYESIEEIFISQARESFSFPISLVDQSIWFIMRNI